MNKNKKDPYEDQDEPKATSSGIALCFLVLFVCFLALVDKLEQENLHKFTNEPVPLVQREN
jgi:hypothetical protein